MECERQERISENNSGYYKTKLMFIRTFRKLNGSLWYAGLIVYYVVPFVLCDLNPGRLTYEEIYNSTKYAQIRKDASHGVPLNLLVSNFSNKESQDGSEYFFKDKYELSNSGQLLVGFARDPYRLSIPEADYLNGVRNIDPKQLNKGDRGKRGVIHLYNMLTCATGCDPISYKGYGCYCGFLGSGRPTDPIDNCCKLHDECYENVHCPFYTVYFQPYFWKCYHREPLCALENHQSRHQFINGCAGRLCECDRRFAMCVRKYHCPRKPALCRSSPLRLLQNLLMSK